MCLKIYEYKATKMINPSDETENEPRKPFPGPQGRHQHQQYKFTAEELRVIRECNKESFYQRCLPLGAILGGGVYYGVKSGFLKASPRFGATPKVVAAVVVGYFIGKFSYQSKCAEKLMQLPNSQIGEMLRQRRRGHLHESLDTGFGPSMSLAPFSGMSSSDTYTDLNPNNSLDLDTTRPDTPGLDDYQRPSLDNHIYEEEMPPIQKHTTSYEELRNKNREEYQQRRIGNYREPAKASPSASPSSESSNPDLSSDTYSPATAKTKYGDTWS